MNIQLVVGDAGALTTGDTWMQSFLQGLGHTVTPVTQTAAPSIDGVDAAVVMTSTTSSLHTGWASADVPILSVGRISWPVLGWSTTGGTAFGASVTHLRPYGDAHATHDGHPSPGATAGDGTYDVQLLSAAASNWRYPTGVPAALATRWRYGSDVANPIIFSLDAGATLLDGKTAVRRQVGWGIGSDADVTTLNADGEGVLTAALGWITDDSSSFDPANAAVVVNGTTASLSWDASPTPGVIDYSIFRRTPPTGAQFDPNVDTPIASGVVGTTYDDEGLTDGDYEWQVFGRS